MLDGAQRHAAPPEQAHRLLAAARRRPASKDHSLAMPVGMAVSPRRRDALRRGVRLEQDRRLRHRGARERHVRSRSRAAPTTSRSAAAARAASSLDAARNRLYVLTRFDNAISVVDLAHARRDRSTSRSTTPSRPAVVDGPAVPLRRRHHVEQRRGVVRELPHLRRHGRPRLGPRQPRRRRDDESDPDQPRHRDQPAFQLPAPINGTGSVNDFHPMKGPMTTQTLRGMASSGAMHWRGDRSNPPRHGGVGVRRGRSRSTTSTSPSPACSGATAQLDPRPTCRRSPTSRCRSRCRRTRSARSTTR